jgi:succinyl-CoA synthetase beta subunit
MAGISHASNEFLQPPLKEPNMPPLTEYRTRTLLAGQHVPLVEADFVPAGSAPSQGVPPLPVYVKAQIPGATSRAAKGLVRRIETAEALRQALHELLDTKAHPDCEGVLVARPVTMKAEYYIACMLDFGSADRLPGGTLLFSVQGGSGVEGRTESLCRLPFSLLQPPAADRILAGLPASHQSPVIGAFLENFIQTFVRYKLIVLEANPVGVREDGSLVVIDCRAEFESHAVAAADKNIFAVARAAAADLTPLEKIVEKINAADPAGTGFVRENRQTPPAGAWKVATNLCGGGGKMLWEMTTGSRTDIFSMNESDTSGGLSAFKSYRIARAILAMKGSQVLLLTGSGMGFQNQYYLAAAIWKALRESPTPLPALLRFGGTDEDKAAELFRNVAETLPVKVKTYLPYVFPNAMVDDIPEMAAGGERAGSAQKPENQAARPPTAGNESCECTACGEGGRIPPFVPLTGEPTFRTAMPPGDFYFFPEKWPGEAPPPSVTACPTAFLQWDPARRTVTPAADKRCIGCLACETAALLDGKGELRIKLDLPEVNA